MAGRTPAFFYQIIRKISMKELSIFIDESGDFGRYDHRSPWYIIAMVFHEQSNSIQEPVEYLEEQLTRLGLENHCLHTGPIIRKEEYANLDYLERRRIFNKLVTFMRQSQVKYKAVSVEKKHIKDTSEFSNKLSKQISAFINNHYEYFLSFDAIKVYYDNG